MTTESAEEPDGKPRALRKADRDIVALGIATAAIIMFLGTGASVMPQIVRAWMGVGLGPDRLLVNALLLNIALIIFGWRRYRELTEEIAERCRAEERARILAETDELTGCLNRRSIESATDRLIAEVRAEHSDVAFAIVDLDNFKAVNDLNGHKVGDALLKMTADRLTRLLPPRSLVARLGGDEFACVIPFEKGHAARVDQLVGKVIEQTGRPAEIEGVVAEITVSIGIAASGSEDEGNALDAEVLMHRADIAMYHAKKQGKNCYFWFEEPMESELRLRNELETGIRRGIERGEFVPFYEQQIDLETGDLVGFEMLARWNSPKHGLVSPEVFIPIAEDLGVIGELSEHLIAQALVDASEWDPRLTLSVNISPVQLRDPWFSQKLLKLVVEHGFPPQRLDVEITESCLHENIAVVRSMITSLHNQGVTISLDDFGTGFSSLAQLRSLPFNRLKIDRSFVTELGGEKPDSRIVGAIVSLAEGLGLPITAEGIEDEQILATLAAMGRLKGQGYHYGRPEDAATVRERLRGLGLLCERAGSSEAAPGAGEPATDESEERYSATG